MNPPNTLVVDAPAKVNLFLRVLGRRPDGYHELQSAILPISLKDRLTIHAFADPGQFRTLSLSLSLSGDPALLRGVPAEDSNLALRAAMALADAVRPRGFADIALHKRIPAAAGLGGGSADAAATLLALNSLWGSVLDPPTLRTIGAGVGSDVPALMLGGAALVAGRGEQVQPIRVAPLRWALVTFAFGVSTAEAFRWWDEDSGGSGPDPEPVLLAARDGQPGALGSALYNDLEEPVMRRHPEVRRVKERLLEEGAAGAIMCGSGPTVAALLPEGGTATDGLIEAESV